MPADRSPSTAAEDLDKDLDRDLAGLDNLDTPLEARVDAAVRLWNATWPKLLALALALLVWQLVAASGWRPSDVLPGPGPVLRRLWDDLVEGTLPRALGVTMTRAFVGYGIAVVLGVAVGLAVARGRALRSAVGSLLTALQTLPSIAWFPLALLLFPDSEWAILVVVVFGAAPAIANGLLHGVDHIPPLLLRAGKVLGAEGLNAYRFVVLPAALPSFTAGLKQGWAFAWRGLMAGELLVAIAGRPSLGLHLQLARDAEDATALLAALVAILIVGIVVDGLLFGPLERSVRRRWGLAAEKAKRP